MLMRHRSCGGEVAESRTRPAYQDEEYGLALAYECTSCGEEILGDTQIKFVAESTADALQIEALEGAHQCR